MNGCCLHLLLNSIHLSAKAHTLFDLTNSKRTTLQTRLLCFLTRQTRLLRLPQDCSDHYLSLKTSYKILTLPFARISVKYASSLWKQLLSWCPFKNLLAERVKSCFSLFMNCNTTRNLMYSHIVLGQNITVCSPIGHVSIMLWSILGYPH